MLLILRPAALFLAIFLLITTACSGDEASGALSPDEAAGAAGESMGGALNPNVVTGPELCGSTVCRDGQRCNEGVCIAACSDPALLCGEQLDFCCAAGTQTCLMNECVAVGTACEFSEQCALGEYCEPNLGRCLVDSGRPLCEFRPPVGVFSPAIGCRWDPPVGSAYENSAEVVMTPSIANLSDDNDDGVTDSRDIPDIVFVSFDRSADGCCTAKGVVRVISGGCEPDGSMRTLATLGKGPDDGDDANDPWIDNSTGIALANLHPDSNADERTPEIVATMQGGGAIAWRRTASDASQWEVLWHNTDYPSSAHNGGSRANHSGAQPSVADLNADGQPEVIIGNVVLDGLTGALVWDGLQTVGASAGIGNNAFLGPISTVADIDLDGVMEVIAGHTVYDGRDGSEEWSYTYVGNNSSCGGRLPCDGYNAVGNFDDDDFGEVVIVRRGEVFVLEHDGTEKYRVAIPRQGGGANEGGPPTVADFDGDGRPEIGIASRDYYVVFDFQCTGTPLPDGCAAENVRWQVENNDASSRVTGSSVFDFEGDGKAEVIYADETDFRIYDGSTGAVLHEDSSHSSNTRLEMPVVVDVDNDGKSEVIIPEPNTAAGLGGIEVWEDADNNWVRTRRIWNQHSYHVSNISEDGQVPRYESPNWLNGRLNNFRQNIQPDGLFDAPDFTVQSVELLECQAETARLVVTVANEGALGVPAGVPVFVSAQIDQSTIDLGVVRTTRLLLPGQRDRIGLDWNMPQNVSDDTFRVQVRVDADDQGNGSYNECNEANNEGDFGPFERCESSLI